MGGLKGRGEGRRRGVSSVRREVPLEFLDCGRLVAYPVASAMSLDIPDYRVGGVGWGVGEGRRAAKTDGLAE